MQKSILSLSVSSEHAVHERYSAASLRVEAALCCPVQYSNRYLDAVPQEIIEKDYGCGDPSAWVREGETVLDLGSGGGKLCYIISQVVGPQGRVIGIDCNPEMLALARKYQDDVARTIGYANVEFRFGMIQDLQLNLELLNERLAAQPVGTAAGWLELRQAEEHLRQEKPLVANDSIDCVVSNCVLNLVRQSDRAQLFREIFRVLRPGGRAVISDIVSDKMVPEHLQRDGRLWSGCLSGAFREDLFVEAFAAAGFHGITIAKRQSEPWRTIEGIEFRSMTVVAWKNPSWPAGDVDQAVIYRGPFRTVEDDHGEVFQRGQRTAVRNQTLARLQASPFADLFEVIQSREPLSREQAREPEVNSGASPVEPEAKVQGLALTIQPDGNCCGDGRSCC